LKQRPLMLACMLLVAVPAAAEDPVLNVYNWGFRG